ncbi:MAG: rod shape-determining protein RodA [Cyclobacteriaceae bacterium]
MRNNLLIYRLDWLAILVYLVLIFAGWLNIYAAEYNPEIDASMFSLSTSAGRQLMWIGTSLVLIGVIMLVDFKAYSIVAYPVYGTLILMLIAVLLFGREVAGSRSWFEIGSFKLQPSEFTKFAAALGLAKYLSSTNKKTESLNSQVVGSLIFILPMLLIIAQGDLGSAMVFGSLIIVMFREGMHPVIFFIGLGAVVLFMSTLIVNQTILLISLVAIGLVLVGLFSRKPGKLIIAISGTIVAIAFVLSVDFILNDVLKPHQQKRVYSLIDPNADPLGIGWNVMQSKIAIGSGGFSGKGYLEGTQTKFDFVPEQTTDFIFCTIGEEQGWIGSLLLIILFTTLFLRLIFLAERQKSIFARVYGYCVVCVLFFHFAVNIAMTIGLFPVIGIPLPFFSYGGSSLWGFTVLLFIFLKLDAHRMQVLQRA